jgi:hypothetical protein
MRTELERYTRESSLFASPIKFGKWLTEHFAEEILQRRRAREHSAKSVKPALTDKTAPVGASAGPQKAVPAAAQVAPLQVAPVKVEPAKPVKLEPVMSETPPPVTVNVAPAGKAAEIARSEAEPQVLVASGELSALSNRPPKALWAAAAVLIMIVLIVLLTL